MKFIVNGGKKLTGTLRVGGSKNAALPILAATLLTSRPCVISNLPLIGDVLTLINILQELGSKIEWLDKHTVRITNKNIDPLKIPKDLVRRVRASILLIGSLAARFGKVHFHTPGGCHIGVRPMDAHFDAFRELGFSVTYKEEKDLYEVRQIKKRRPKVVVLKEFSVTATENLLMFGALNSQLSIETAAAEPHIQDLGRFLRGLGADIEGLGTHTIKIKRNISGGGGEVKHTIINDYIEAGTFMVLAAATKSNLLIEGVPVGDLLLPIQKLKEFGVKMEISGSKVKVWGGKSQLRAGKKIMAQPHPGFPADLQAPFGVLATQAQGETLIFDTLYEGRLKYLYELDKMGAAVDILNSHQALIKGPKRLVGKNVESIDLRAGVTLVIAALVAEGQSILHAAEQIDRGYEELEGRLRQVGADIRREA